MAEQLTQKQMIESIFQYIQRPPPKPDGFDRLVERLDEAIDKLEEISETVYGNGKVGLTEDVRTLQSKMGSISKVFWLVVGVAVAAITTGVITWIVNLFKY